MERPPKGRPPSGTRAMTDAERAAKYRAKRRATKGATKGVTMATKAHERNAENMRQIKKHIREIEAELAWLAAVSKNIEH